MAATGAGGVCLKPVRAKVITSPASYRTQKAEAAGDSCEDLGVKQHAESDIDEGDPVVDTDAESSAESGNTTGSASDSSTGSEEAPKKAPPNKVPATGGTMPATGGSPDKPAKHGKSGPTIYDNGYFYIMGHERDLKMYIHDRWLVEPPRCSLLILKAWVICRARAHPGWIESNEARQRRFTEEADVLFHAVKRLQPQAEGLLANARASHFMRVSQT